MIRAAVGATCIMLASAGCLLAPNPDFIESNGSETNVGETNGGDCPTGTLDCDGEPGCEADVDDPSNCGSCSKSCEMAGEMLECSAGVCSGSVVFGDLEDAYVDAELPDDNFGDAPTLRIDELRDAFIKLPDLVVPGAAIIDSIRLQLTCTTAGSTVDLHEVGGNWSESSMTANNAPSLGGTVLKSFTPTLGDTSVEIQGLIQEWEQGSPNRGFGLRAEPGGTLVECSSSEGAAGPTVVVTLHW